MKFLFTLALFFLISLTIHAQYVGIGTNNPTEQLHTTEGVRFEGLTQNDTLSAIVSRDINGKLFWKTVNSLSKNFWSLSGNSSTNPGTGFGQHYLGTADANRIVFATNSFERMTILPGGRVGIGTVNPQSALQIHSNISDSHLRITGVAPGILFFDGAASNPTSQWAKIGFATTTNDFVQGSKFGDMILQTFGNGSSVIFGNGSSVLNGFESARFDFQGHLGISTNSPTAALHINCAAIPLIGSSNVRFENLQQGGGYFLVIDANGYVRRSASSLAGRDAQQKEIDQLKTELAELKAQFNILSDAMKANRDTK